MAGIDARFRLDWPGFSLDVDLTLPGRGVTALFGHSGSGKTTLLCCIAGLERAREGRLAVDGEVWQDASRWVPTHRRPIGYVFQEASLFAHLSVMGNLRYGMKRVSDAQRVSLDQAIELLAIGHLLDRKPDRLSGGERQRVGMARALAVSPRLLLMDEPLAALDLKRKQEILPYLERLHDELEIPILDVSHSPDEVARQADYLVSMQQGRVAAAGPVNATLTARDSAALAGEEASALLQGTVIGRDPQWSLVQVGFPGGELWVRDSGLPVGHALRLRILARDVSLATEEPRHTSIQNHLPCMIDSVAPDAHPSQALVRLACGESVLLARVTRRALDSLALTPGKRAWAQLKSVAVVQ